MRCRLGASTSQSAYARASASLIKALAMVVFPVPPLPLRISNCFMPHLPSYCFQDIYEQRRIFFALRGGNTGIRIQPAKFLIKGDSPQNLNLPFQTELLRR